jgi:biopolymer transport protein ExbD
MAMNLGGKSKADLNVTPMIDVLLVLLIIYMVASTNTVGLEAKVPQDSKGPAVENLQDIVILVHADRSITLNTESLAEPEIEPRLKGIYATRGNHPIFIAADEDIAFDPVAHLIDIAKGVGLDQVALLSHAP